MKGNPDVIKALQQVLESEMTAINQYFLHAEMCEDWGLAALSQHIKQDSIDEMKHAEIAIERMLYLEGLPNMSPRLELNIGGTVEEMFKYDLALEYKAVENLNKHITRAAEVGDNGTRDIFLGILKDEERHVEWLETQLALIEQIGIQNYLAKYTGQE